MTSTHEIRTTRVVLAAAAVALVFVAIPYLRLPLAGEQGQYAFGAWLMRRGGVPYRDLWDNNAPAAFALHWLAEVVFGHGTASIRWLDLVWMIATLAVAHALARRAFGSVCAAVAVLLMIVFYFTLGYQVTAERDGFGVLPLFAMIWIALREPRSRRDDLVDALGIGFCTAAIFWLKPPLALAGAVCAVVLLRRSATHLGAKLAGFALGFAIPSLLVVASLQWSGALPSLLEFVVRGNARYVHERLPLSILFLRIARVFKDEPVLVIGLVGLGMASTRHAGRVLAAVALALLATVVIQGKLLSYHMVPLRFLLWLCAAYAFTELFRTQRWRAGARSAALAGIAIVAASAWLAFASQGAVSLWSAWLRGTEMPLVQREETKLATLVARISAPDESVLVWGVGSACSVLYLAERRSPTRFAMNYVFSLPEPDDALAEKWRGEFLDAVRGEPPRVVVVAGGDQWEAIGNLDSTASFERFAALRDFVAQHYELVARVGGGLHYQVYRRSDSR